MGAALFLGLILGMRHALEPDHLAAVSTLVSDRRTRSRAASLGLFWGLGHTTSLLVVGIALAALGTLLPAGVANAFEVVVAFMLIVLGALAVRRAIRRDAHPPGTLRIHQHSAEHVDGDVTHVHVGRWMIAGRPLFVGLIHGLAGSGALTALVLAELPSLTMRLLYMLLFGLGSALGMALLSGIAGWSISRIAARDAAQRALSLLTGTASAGLGIFWGATALRQLVG
jgi:ABC-type nickel/cobalt efflux system permease component RcnA